MAVGVHPQRGWWRCGGVGDAMQAVGVHPQVAVAVMNSAERGCTPKGSGNAVQCMLLTFGVFDYVLRQMPRAQEVLRLRPRFTNGSSHCFVPVCKNTMRGPTESMLELSERPFERLCILI